MKRITALLLCLLLILAAWPAGAADDYTIEEKFYNQAVLESAYRGTVTLIVSGSGSSAIDPAVWTVLKSVAPRLSLEIDHSVAREGDGQATATLLLDGQSVGKTAFLYNDQLMGLSSTVLAGEDVYYTASRDWNALEWLQGAALGKTVWPPVLGVAAAAATAPQEWQDRVASYLTPFETKLGNWLNSYASFQTGTDENGVGYTEMDFTIPALAVKSEMKQLLVDFYGNAELLTLLREVVPAREAAAYLDPGMLNGFLLSLDGLQLEGDVEIIRRYDGQGHSLLDEVHLPFGEGQELDHLILTSHHTQDGVEWMARGRTQSGADFDLYCLAAEDGIYTGSVDLLLPEEEDGSFVVDDGTEPQRRSVAFDFNLSWDPGEETYDIASDKFERVYQASLLIKPRGEDAGPTQSLALEAKFSTGSSKRSSTRLDATLEWRDLDAGASVLFTLDSRTVSPFAITSLDQVTGAVRIDQMDATTQAALLERWAQSAQGWLTGLATRLAIQPLATNIPVFP